MSIRVRRQTVVLFRTDTSLINIILNICYLSINGNGSDFGIEQEKTTLYQTLAGVKYVKCIFKLITVQYSFIADCIRLEQEDARVSNRWDTTLRGRPKHFIISE